MNRFLTISASAFFILSFFGVFLTSFVSANLPPTTPTNLVAERVGPTEIRLTWNKSVSSSDISGYKIMRNNYSVTIVTNTSFQDSSLDGFTAYNYSVSSVDIYGNESEASLPSSITTLDNSDTNLDGRVQTLELFNYINQWKLDNEVVPIRNIIRAIGLWKTPQYIINVTTCSNHFDQECPLYCSNETDADCCASLGGFWLKSNESGTDVLKCFNRSYEIGCQPAQPCTNYTDGCCPNWCAPGSDADCCLNQGKHWLSYIEPMRLLGNLSRYGCYDSGYNLGCDSNSLCSSYQDLSIQDGCCPNWCSSGSDIDCCLNSGGYWLYFYAPQILYPNGTLQYALTSGCYPTSYNPGCSTDNKCNATIDGCCPNWCAPGSDADCCINAGKHWLNTSQGWDCWDEPEPCVARSSCKQTPDGICPSCCLAGNDYDCCTNAGKFWLQTPWGYACYSSSYNPGCSPGQQCSSTREDSCCPNWCTAGSDADC